MTCERSRDPRMANGQMLERADGGKELRFHTQPGLVRLSVDADASPFDWESLFVVLNVYGNVNQRTGPWDFNLLEGNRPVLPAYWFYLDDRKIGLGYFNRPSAKQLDEKRLRGEFSFWITEAGEHVLRLEPYRPFNIVWNQVHFGPDWENSLEPPPATRLNLIDALLPDRMPRNRFTDGFLRSAQWAKTQLLNPPINGHHGGTLVALAAAYRWRADAEILKLLRSAIEEFVLRPAWNNSREDGYGHNGDMDAAKCMWGLAVVIAWLNDELTDLKDAVLARLARQGNTFVEMALLHQGHWGGSLLQDHGWTSFSWFTAAAYALQHLLPGHSRRWLGFSVPRMERSLAALPADGAVPPTSYHNLFMYVDKIAILSHLHHLATGVDWLNAPSLRAIPAAAMALYSPENFAFAYPSPRGDLCYFDGGHSFLARFPDDVHAQWLLRQFLCPENLARPRDGFPAMMFNQEWLWAMLLDRNGPDDAAKQPELPKSRHFADSGMGVIRAGGGLLVTRCGAPTSRTSYRRTTCAADRICFAPMSGAFTYIHEGRRVIHTAEGGYRMNTALGNVLLVDGKGQRGDAGIPMSHPDAPYHGESIVEMNEDSAIMNLTPAYEGLARYERTLRLLDSGAMEVIDSIESPAPRRLCWRFHTFMKNALVRQSDVVWLLTIDGHPYRITIMPGNFSITTRIVATKTVWAYVNTNDGQACHHLSIEAHDLDPWGTLRLRIDPG